MCLRPECLPGALEELELLGLHHECLGFLAWAPLHSGVGVAGRLPRLHTLRVTRVRGEDLLSIDKVPLLEGFPCLPGFVVDCSGTNFDVDDNLFGQVTCVRIVAGGYMRLWGAWESVAMFVDRLCPAGLRAAELCAEHCYHCYQQLGGGYGFTREVVRDMIGRYSDRFAVDFGEKLPDEGPWNNAEVHCLAWRRWPAIGAPGLPAARAAHERARAWAVE